ncbi:hypothetical protein ES708_26457 [subsurface metagenome]
MPTSAFIRSFYTIHTTIDFLSQDWTLPQPIKRLFYLANSIKIRSLKVRHISQGQSNQPKPPFIKITQPGNSFLILSQEPDLHSRSTIRTDPQTTTILCPTYRTTTHALIINPFRLTLTQEPSLSKMSPLLKNLYKRNSVQMLLLRENVNLFLIIK